jgi:hypothetical protein
MRLHNYLFNNHLNIIIMETKAPKKHYTWYAPEGYWYTQRSVADEHQRMFVRAISGKTENTINNWVLWTDEQKAEWEELWLTEPEGESK